MTHHTVGVDISKAHLDAWRLPEGKAAKFTNDTAGFTALIAWAGSSVNCVAYAVLLGAADTLGVPDGDLNVTITGGDRLGKSAVVHYDNVPGGAGLVAQLEREDVFREVLDRAADWVQGNCGCDTSCYGCLRSYRNQFAHPNLDRNAALRCLESLGNSLA